MAQQLENLTALLQNMTADNAELAGHNTTLEKAVIFKDHEVSQLQERNHVSTLNKLVSTLLCLHLTKHA